MTNNLSLSLWVKFSKFFSHGNLQIRPKLGQRGRGRQKTPHCRLPFSPLNHVPHQSPVHPSHTATTAISGVFTRTRRLCIYPGQLVRLYTSRQHHDIEENCRASAGCIGPRMAAAVATQSQHPSFATPSSPKTSYTPSKQIGRASCRERVCLYV